MDQKTLLFVSIFWLLAALFATPLRAEEPLGASNEVWIDVRTQEEYQGGHLEGAINIPYDRIGDRITAAVPDKAQPIRLYCRSGRRAAIAKQTLDAMGYRRVTNVGGLADAKAMQAEPLATH